MRGLERGKTGKHRTNGSGVRNLACALGRWAPNIEQNLRGSAATARCCDDHQWRRAAEAELLANKEKYRLVYRIDGVPTEHPDGVSTEDGERIVRYLKKIAGLNVEEIRRPQTGRIQVGLLSQEKEPGHTEVRTSGTTAGEKLQLRIHAGPSLRRLHELGISRPRLERLKQVLAKHNGQLAAAPGQI